MLAARHAECVGIVSLAAGLECIDVTALVGTMNHKFLAAATAPNGLVVLAPDGAGCVGIVDAAARSEAGVRIPWFLRNPNL